MSGHKKSKVILITITVSILLVITKFLSTKTDATYEEDFYISQFLPPSQNRKVASGGVADANKSSYNNSHNTVNTHEPNITTAVLKGEDVKTEVKIVCQSEKQKDCRNVFVEMRNISKSTQNIFFIETRCSSEKINVYFKVTPLRGMVLNARQCCAIESTALMNLDHKIYIFHSCSLDDDFILYSPKFVEKLFQYPNIYVVRFNISEVFVDSPLEELGRKKLLETSKYPVEHTSDLVRLVLLWKFGGTYSDLDVVTIRSLNNLKTNWAGMQDEVTIANGVINFEPEGEGHRMLQEALEYSNSHYDPTNWSSNGPLLITPIILKECGVQTVPEAQKRCTGRFTVFNSSILYPIYYPNAYSFFNDSAGQKIVSYVKKKSYSVHIWNKMSHDFTVTVGSTQAYALLADEYCPEVYRNCGPTF